MTSIDCNIFIFLFLAHIIDIFHEYHEIIMEYLQFSQESKNPAFYSPSSMLRGIEMNFPYISTLFKTSKKKKNELEAKNIILEGIVKSENYIACRMNLKSPISYEYFKKKKDFSKYSGAMNFHLAERNPDLQNQTILVRKSLPRQKIKVYDDAIIRISKNESLNMEDFSFWKKLMFSLKTFIYDFFAFKSFTLSYEESEFVLKNNDFLRIYGDISYNLEKKTFESSPKIIFSSLKNVIKSHKERLRILEKKMLLYIVLFSLYVELRVLHGKHILALFDNLIQKFSSKKSLLNRNNKRIDLQTLEGNKSEVKCLICTERIREIVFKPCNHMVICERCLYKCTELKCPLCRQPILDILVVFGE